MQSEPVPSARKKRPRKSSVALPAETLRLLDELQSIGLDNQSFSILHHVENESLKKYRSYCTKQLAAGSKFLQNASNEHAQRRLAMVLGAFRGGDFPTGVPAVLECLARAAVAALPIRGGLSRATQSWKS
jgi:hypothetical protein